MKIWIARDNNTRYKQLFGYYNKPIKMDDWFVGDVCCEFNRELFPEVTFENSPMEVELKLIEK
jgi:hypothetical protein